jgi:putative ABC transport system substrate-binding protein
MRRREFITLISGAVAGPLAARAQHSTAMRRIGVLMSGAETDPVYQMYVGSLRKGLQELGWAEGRNIQIELRWGSADDLVMQKYAVEFAQSKPDVLIGNAPTSTRALQQVTKSIPIIFVQIPDPVEAGFVASISHPGGNITGFTHFEPTMASKWIGLLKQISPALDRFAILFNPVTISKAYLPPLLAAAQSFAVEPIETSYHNEADIEDALGKFAEVAKGGLIVLPDASNTLNRNLIIKLAAQHRLPAIYAYAYFVTDGGLVCYGVDAPDLFRRAASYVDRILKGENPANLPVQAPTKFELVINLKTAKDLGLTVPQPLLATADRVIE